MVTRVFSAYHTTRITTTTPHGERETETDRDRGEETRQDKTRQDKTRQERREEREERREERREKNHFQCGGAWPFLVDGVFCLVNSVCARVLSLLQRVKYDSSLISFSAPWPVNSFLISANYIFYAVAVFNFF